jgi:flagellar hook-associated protein 2
MAEFSSLGVGSGLDLTTLLTQLTTESKQPLVALQARATSYTTKLSAYGQVQSSLGGLQTASAKLADLSLFQGVKAYSSFNSVLTATAKSTAVAGSYAINVTQLAQSQSLATVGQAGTTSVIGNGTLTIDFGTFTPAVAANGDTPSTPASFAANADRTATTVVIGEGSNTLEGIRDAINAQRDGGVTASIVNDGSGTPYRLILVSAQTGQASSMKISVDGDAALSTLMKHDPANAPTMTEIAAAKNAQLTVNGLAVTSATNTVAESMEGVTLNLVKTGESTLTVARDTSSATSAINAFVAAYNSLLGVGKTLTNYDPDTKTGAALTGDFALRNMQVQLRSTLTSSQGSGTGDLTMLSNIGVSFEKDGKLKVDATKLDSALTSNLDGVAKLFAGTATDTAGYGKQVSALALGLTASGGALTVAANGMTSSIKLLDKDYDAMSLNIDATVARYKAQFTQLDVMMSSMNSTSTYLTAQFAAMNATSSK